MKNKKKCRKSKIITVKKSIQTEKVFESYLGSLNCVIRKALDHKLKLRVLKQDPLF